MQAEEDACLKIVEEFKNQKIIISTGGGICDNAPALEILSQFGTFIFLKAPEEVSIARILNKTEQLSDGTWKNLPAYISNKNPKTEKEIRTIFHDFPCFSHKKQYNSLRFAANVRLNPTIV